MAVLFSQQPSLCLVPGSPGVLGQVALCLAEWDNEKETGIQVFFFPGLGKEDFTFQYLPTW